MKTYQITKRLDQWEVSIVKATSENKAIEKWEKGLVEKVHRETASSQDGEYEIEEMFSLKLHKN